MSVVNVLYLTTVISMYCFGMPYDDSLPNNLNVMSLNTGISIVDLNTASSGFSPKLHIFYTMCASDSASDSRDVAVCMLYCWNAKDNDILESNRDGSFYQCSALGLDKKSTGNYSSASRLLVIATK